ncbi:receptor-type tyrosine-protein phosphatase beta-like [Neosynchiropus ocellatus]
MSNTMADFWRMVWEQNVRVIVMVTALKYKDTVLCDKYWPLERGTVYHGLIQVTTMARKQGPNYFITTINLRQRDSAADRIITHYYYPAWPDRGVPKEPSSLCIFTEHVRQHLESIPRLGPAVVHCSAGVGRSGTFVTLLWLMQLCARGIRPDIRAAVEDLRLHRMWMVQNQEQYIFVHQCLLHWLGGGTARINAVAPLGLESRPARGGIGENLHQSNHRTHCRCSTRGTYSGGYCLPRRSSTPALTLPEPAAGHSHVTDSTRPKGCKLEEPDKY